MASIAQLLASLRAPKSGTTAPTPAPAPAPVVIPVQFQPTPAPAATPTAPASPFTLQPQQVMDFASKLNFTSSIDDATLTTALQNPAALRTLMETVGRQAFASATMASAQHIGSQFDSQVEARMKAFVPSQMQQMSLETALAAHPVYSKPGLMQTAAKTRAQELRATYPDASPAEILDVISAELEASGYVAPTQGPAPAPAGPEKTDYDNLWASATPTSPVAIETANPQQQQQSQSGLNAPQSAPASVPSFQFVPQGNI